MTRNLTLKHVSTISTMILHFDLSLCGRFVITTTREYVLVCDSVSFNPVPVALAHGREDVQCAELFEGTGTKTGVKGVTPSKTHRFWPICMESFATFLYFSFLFLIFLSNFSSSFEF